MFSGMNHDEDRYENPDSFVPKRWMKGDRTIQSFDQFTFPTFQGGPRICLGKDLALYETKILLVEVLKTYKIELANEIHRKETARPGWRKNVMWINGAPVYELSLVMTLKDELRLKMFKR